MIYTAKIYCATLVHFLPQGTGDKERRYFSHTDLSPLFRRCVGRDICYTARSDNTHEFMGYILARLRIKRSEVSPCYRHSCKDKYEDTDIDKRIYGYGIFIQFHSEKIRDLAHNKKEIYHLHVAESSYPALCASCSVLNQTAFSGVIRLPPLQALG